MNVPFTGPYLGLEPFDETSAAFFFGRERETRLVTASLFASPLTLLYGDSGVGKSSVLRAGVLLKLREKPDVLPVMFPRFVVYSGSKASIERGWQTDPVSGIKESILIELRASAGEDEDLRRKYDKAVWKYDMAPIPEFVDAVSEIAGRTIMVILDQFEEYSLYHPEDELFALQFPRAVASRTGSASFLLSLREDALAKLDRFKATIPTLWDSYRRIDHLDRAAAEEAVRRPLDEYNRRRPAGAAPIQIETALVEEVLRDVRTAVKFEGTGTGSVETTADGHIETPYLQLVMARLWEREQGDGSSTLRLATLKAEGGAPTIVGTHLDRVMAQFSSAERDIAARIFHRLVTPSGSKIAFSVHDLAQYEALDVKAVAPILMRLEEGQRRILRRVAAPDELQTGPRYEIFHDRLGKAILSWRARWLAEQAREQSVRQEEEQKRLAEEARATLRATVAKAMDSLGDDGQAVWASLMLDLVSTDGKRLVRAVGDLAGIAKQPVAAVRAVLDKLIVEGILRRAYSGNEGNPADWYEVVHDTMAASLLEWHSTYVRERADKTRRGTGKSASHAAAASESAEDTADTFPYEFVRHLFERGEVIPFLGAGASWADRPGGSPPLARDFKELLARRAEFPASEFESSDVAEVASYFVHKFNRPRLDDLLQGLDDPTYAPTATHSLIADFARSAPLVILTTNYDSLMERALRDAGVPFDVLAYVPDREHGDRIAWMPHGERAETIAASHLPRRPDRTMVFKLYGPSPDPDQDRRGYVITEEDHIDWIQRLGGRPSFLPPHFQEALRHRHLLSLGHSARDWSQRALLRIIDEGVTRFERVKWAISLRPSPLSIMAWQRYRVKIFNADLNEWAARMRETPSESGG